MNDMMKFNTVLQLHFLTSDVGTINLGSHDDVKVLLLLMDGGFHFIYAWTFSTFTEARL